MSKIDELLKNEKVEWKKLGEIAEITGAGVDKKKVLGELPIKLLNYMDVYKNQYINSNIPTMNVTAPENKIQNCNIEFGDIFVTPSSETTDDIFRSGVATEDIFNTVYSYHIMRVRLKNKSFITSCYLNYLFQSENFREKLYKRVFGNTRKTIAKSEIEQLQIPIPSIETQEKIVKTLDKFTNYVTKLQSELQSRTKQYEYYRDMLLSEEYLNKISTEIMSSDNNREITFCRIKDVCNRQKGINITAEKMKELNNDDSPVKIFAGGSTTAHLDVDVVGKKNVIEIPSVIVKSRGNIDFEYYDKPFSHKNEMWSYSTINDEVLSIKFLFYLLKNNLKYFKDNSISGKLPQISTGVTDNYKIPIIPIVIQNKVVEILDKFQSLLADTKGLLPQEIEQRQKQYEYYREKLLTFDENSVKRERERESISL